ncbi:MAG: PEP-CTERM sorting domain-containing protein [Candidatus Korobacteraceae bacterium]
MRFRVLILTVLVMSCVLQVHATPQSGDPQSGDPRIIVNNTHDPLGVCAPMPVGNDFSFSANVSGGGKFCFMNDSGDNWHFLEIETRGTPPENTILCGGGTFFSTCLVQPQPVDGFTIIDFFGGAGLPNGQEFSIDLGLAGWQPNEQFLAFANPVPEPGSLALFLTGLTPLLARRIVKKL